jgi:hypothetical protein
VDQRIKNSREIEEILEKLTIAQDQRARGQRGKTHKVVMKSLRKRIKTVKKK